MNINKPDIYNYDNAQKYIQVVVKKNKLTANKLKELLGLKSVAYAWSIYSHGIVSTSMVPKLITFLQLNEKEASYFRMIVDIPKMPSSTMKEKTKLLSLVKKNVKRYGIQERNP